jgi:periplasmic protein TonB
MPRWSEGPVPEKEGSRSANDRLKASWNAWLMLSIISAAVAHAAALAFWPTVEIPDWTHGRDLTPAEIVALEPPTEAALPPPPAEVPIPVPPVLQMANLDPIEELDLTMPDLSEAFHFAPPIPPLQSEAEDPELARFANFAPYMIPPRINNQTEVDRFLRREFGRVHNRHGIAGVVHLMAYIDENGRVHQARIDRSSGEKILDELALQFSRVASFIPAYNWGRPVAVAVSIPVVFQIR